jgi:hypothetical protein
VSIQKRMVMLGILMGGKEMIMVMVGRMRAILIIGTKKKRT